MKFVGLMSGGKDSVFSILCCVREGHCLVGVVNLHAADGTTELDSHMFQVAGHTVVKTIARLLNVPLFARPTLGQQDSEIDDLLAVVAHAKTTTGCEGVCSGAVLSDYQRVRIEGVCSSLGLTSLAPLWHQEEAGLLRRIATDVTAVLVRVAAWGLTKQHLGRSVNDLTETLIGMATSHWLHPSGEGGEFETIVTACPALFGPRRIELDSTSIVEEGVADTAHLVVHKVHVVECDDASSRQTLPQANFSTQHSLTTYLSHCPSSYVQLFHSDCVHLPEDSVDVKDSMKDSVDVKDLVGDLVGDWPRVETLRGDLDSAFPKSCRPGRTLAFVRVFIHDMARFEEFNAMYETEFLANVSGVPPRLCVGIPGTEAGFVMQLVWFDCDVTRRLHVRSWSHWAPACIGPYSQACVVTPHVFISGQIALVPSCHQLAEDLCAQCQLLLALRHVYQICESLQTPHSSSLIVYHTHVVSTSPLFHAVHAYFRTTGVTHLRVLFVGVKSLPRSAQVEVESHVTFSSQSTASRAYVTKDHATGSHVTTIQCDSLVIHTATSDEVSAVFYPSYVLVD